MTTEHKELQAVGSFYKRELSPCKNSRLCGQEAIRSVDEVNQKIFLRNFKGVKNLRRQTEEERV